MTKMERIEELEKSILRYKYDNRKLSLALIGSRAEVEALSKQNINAEFRRFRKDNIDLENENNFLKVQNEDLVNYIKNKESESYKVLFAENRRKDKCDDKYLKKAIEWGRENEKEVNRLNAKIDDFKTIITVMGNFIGTELEEDE